MLKHTASALLIGALSIPAFAQTDRPYELRYEPETGEIIMTTYGPLINYVIESSNCFFTDNAYGIMGGTGSTRCTLSGSNPFAPLAAGTYSLGPALPAGLTTQEFFDETQPFSPLGNTYTTELGEPMLPFLFVPEPGTLAMLGGGGLLINRRHRQTLDLNYK